MNNSIDKKDKKSNLLQQIDDAHSNIMFQNYRENIIKWLDDTHLMLLNDALSIVMVHADDLNDLRLLDSISLKMTYRKIIAEEELNNFITAWLDWETNVFGNIKKEVFSNMSKIPNRDDILFYVLSFLNSNEIRYAILKQIEHRKKERIYYMIQAGIGYLFFPIMYYLEPFEPWFTLIPCGCILFRDFIIKRSFNIKFDIVESFFDECVRTILCHNFIFSIPTLQRIRTRIDWNKILAILVRIISDRKISSFIALHIIFYLVIKSIHLEGNRKK